VVRAIPAGRQAFTLIEILIVIAVFGILLFLTAPMGINFYRTQQLDTTVSEVIQTLRRAQFNAMAVDGDQTWTVYFEPGQYRLEDEVFDTLDDITFGGLTSVTFSKLTGLPTSTGNITLTLNGEVETISVNSVGRINYE